MNEISEYPELIIGLVTPVGVDIPSFILKLKDYIRQCNYDFNHIRLSSLIEKVDGLKTVIKKSTEFERISTLMTAGDEVRESSGRNDFVAALGIYEIFSKRIDEKPIPKYVHIFDSLKHPDEVQTLRNIYGNGFYLLGISSSRANKLKFLMNQKGMSQNQAEHLIRRDESEGFNYGQHVRDAFYLADGFIDMDNEKVNDQIARIIDLIFGNPCLTPTRDEYAMFLAFASSLRSGDLSRQVGAVIVSRGKEIIATGANDVPCSQGGLYWSDDESDARDHTLGYDANEKKKDEIIVNIMKVFSEGKKKRRELLEVGKAKLKNTGILDIIEYGRAVHAEMEALMSCARSGVSPKNGTIYCTTFPCHNCAKHIVDAGISRVVFIEPYPKSKASELHKDSIYLVNESFDKKVNGRVKFEPFVGIGPRRFIDLFSMNLSSGTLIIRKKDGKKIKWKRENSRIRVPLSPTSYINREISVIEEINKITGGNHGINQKSRRIKS